jgi:GNAT superfamily N-acetyltransferase
MEIASDAHAAPPCSAVTLADGRRVVLRPSSADDAGMLAEFFDAFRAGSLEARRIATTHAGTVRQRGELARPADDRGTIVALAVADGAPVVGVAAYRYAREEESCLVFLLVRDDWQGHGLGSVLLEAAIRDARPKGFRHFHAEMLGGNMRMLNLLRDALARSMCTRVCRGLVRVDFDAA